MIAATRNSMFSLQAGAFPIPAPATSIAQAFPTISSATISMAVVEPVLLPASLPRLVMPNSSQIAGVSPELEARLAGAHGLQHLAISVRQLDLLIRETPQIVLQNIEAALQVQLARTRDYPAAACGPVRPATLHRRLAWKNCHWPLAAVRQRIQLHQQKAHVIQHLDGIPEPVPLQGDVGDSRIPHTLPLTLARRASRGCRLAAPAAAMAV